MTEAQELPAEGDSSTAPDRRVAEGAVVEHAGTAEGSYPRHAGHPDVKAAHEALAGLAVATVNDDGEGADETRGYVVEPRSPGEVRVFWLEENRAIGRDEMPHGSAIDCLALRLAERGWKVERLRRSSRCVYARRPAETPDAAPKTALDTARERAERRQQLAERRQQLAAGRTNAYLLASSAVASVVREMPEGSVLRVPVIDGGAGVFFTRKDLHALAYSGHITADAAEHIRTAVTAHILHGEREVHLLMPAYGMRPALYLADVQTLLNRWDADHSREEAATEPAGDVCHGCGQDHAGDPDRCTHCTGCGRDHAPQECPYGPLPVRAGDLVEAVAVGTHPTRIQMRVDREPWPGRRANSTVITNEYGAEVVYTDTIRVIEWEMPEPHGLPDVPPLAGVVAACLASPHSREIRRLAHLDSPARFGRYVAYHAYGMRQEQFDRMPWAVVQAAVRTAPAGVPEPTEEQMRAALAAVVGMACGSYRTSRDCAPSYRECLDDLRDVLVEHGIPLTD